MTERKELVGGPWQDERVTRSFDLCIIGSGSGNTIVDERFSGLRVALIDSGTFGGTCLNVGCIPTKMYVYPADLARTPIHARPLGVDLGVPAADWPAIRDRIFTRVDAISRAGEKGRRDDPAITVFTAEARFTGPRRLMVGGETIDAERVVVAAGSRPVIADVPGLAEVRYHTSDDVMRLDSLPRSMVILGGGYVAAEFAHVFASFGTAVTVVNRSPRLLSRQDRDIADRFTAEIGQRVDLRLGSTLARVARRSGGASGGGPRGDSSDEAGDGALVTITGNSPGEVAADVLLIATGRRPNGDRLDLGAAGIEVDEEGFVVVDEYQRTTAAGVFALGDVSSHHMLKHVANHEARVVQHNLLHPDAMVRSDHRYVPHAIFSEPQVAAVGLTEAEADERGIAYVVGRADYGETAYGWAMEDTEHFVKVLADLDTGMLIGAHLVGPQATSLIQPLIQAMSFGTRADDAARGQYWPHPAMSEVVENALLDLRLS
jgi:mycothione reductase